MRVIAGTLKGRVLKPPRWAGLRPTSSRLRETVFDILGGRVTGARVLDVYAGTGALGIEAISRGAAWVTFVEGNRRAQALIAENLARCGIGNLCAIIRSKAEQALSELGASPALMPFDIIFLDPPYGQAADRCLADCGQLLRDTGTVVFEHSRRSVPPDAAGRLVRTRTLQAGDSALSFYQCRR
jgi:16S rRNA (guanine(966)-N(2))-methyltransferase RsmD